MNRFFPTPLLVESGRIPEGWAAVTRVLEALAPRQGGAIWIGVLLTFLVAGNHRRLLSGRNVALGFMLIGAPLFLDIRRLEHLDVPPRANPWSVFIFTAVFVFTAFVAAWGLLMAIVPDRSREASAISSRGLGVVLCAVVVMAASVTFGRRPDDAGYYTNLGARRWIETHRLPYADAALKGPDAPGRGAAATYGPLLYASHAAFQMLLDVPSNPPDLDPMSSAYRRPPLITTQLACFSFFLLGLGALFVAGRSVGGNRLGAVLCIVYGASPYVIGLGGDAEVIGGLRFVSHIAPTALVLMAFALHRRPFFAGLALAAGAGVLFVPGFLFPLWLGWYAWRRGGARRFGAGFLIGVAALGALVWFSSPASGDKNPLALFMESTLEHQEGAEYGRSQFGFWGTHPDLAEFWQHPISGSGSLLKPTFIGFSSLCLVAFFLARGRSLRQLAALTAMLAAAVQLWKTHAAGSYVEWYYPFLAIAVLGGPSRRAPPFRPNPPETAGG